MDLPASRVRAAGVAFADAVIQVFLPAGGDPLQPGERLDDLAPEGLALLVGGDERPDGGLLLLRPRAGAELLVFGADQGGVRSRRCSRRMSFREPSCLSTFSTSALFLRSAVGSSSWASRKRSCQSASSRNRIFRRAWKTSVLVARRLQRETFGAAVGFRRAGPGRSPAPPSRTSAPAWRRQGVSPAPSSGNRGPPSRGPGPPGSGGTRSRRHGTASREESSCLPLRRIFSAARSRPPPRRGRPRC